jgi:bifunctional polynucleotide phosphatase/kinase
MIKWITTPSVCYYLNITTKYPIAGFDLDGTLIQTKSDRKFPINENDWKIISPKMIDMINTISKDYNIVIFTNQLGLDKKLGLDKFKHKINTIKKLFLQDISVVISYDNDFYRKPLTGMWTLFDEYSIPKDKSYYVGDAAGRKNDHSDSDLNFAHNIGIRFATPESYLNSTFITSKSSYIELKKWIKIGKIKIKKDPLELLLLVGFPGCGKSTLAMKHYLDNNKYQYVNQDIDKTFEKIHQKCKYAIKNNMSIILDNTNLDYTSRKKYIDMVKDYPYVIKIIVFDIPINVCQHMMYYRANTNKTSSLGSVVYRTLKKRCSFNEDNQINISEEDRENISLYRINKIYVDTKKDYDQIIHFRASLK